MKKILCLIVCLIFTAALAMNAYAKFTRYGDVTGDNKINSSDALAVLTAKVGLRTLSDDQNLAADVDHNGKVNSSDALMILNYAVGNIKEFPADSYSPDPDIGHDVF